MSKRFSKTETELRKLFHKSDSFKFLGETYEVKVVGKPLTMKGECKTDLYIHAESASGEAKEFKISIKQRNADFLENKMNFERAREIFGEDTSNILSKSIQAIKDKFESTPIVYFDLHKPQRHKMTLGWKFEIMNKLSGYKSGKLVLTEQQKIEVYTGQNLSADKRNSKLNGVIRENSGVANYILHVDSTIDKDVDFYMNELLLIEEYAKQKDLYFACKALNYRVVDDKWDGDRPLAVFVNWIITDAKVYGNLIYNKPLLVRGNEIGEKAKELLKKINIDSTNFMNFEQYLHETVRKKKYDNVRKKRK